MENVNETFEEFMARQDAEMQARIDADNPEHYEGAAEAVKWEDCADAEERAERRRRALICAKALKQFVKAAEKFCEIINEEEADGDVAGILQEQGSIFERHTFDQLIKCARYVEDSGWGNVEGIIEDVKYDLDAEMEEEDEEEEEEDDDEEFAELEDALAIA